MTLLYPKQILCIAQDDIKKSRQPGASTGALNRERIALDSKQLIKPRIFARAKNLGTPLAYQNHKETNFLSQLL